MKEIIDYEREKLTHKCESNKQWICELRDGKEEEK